MKHIFYICTAVLFILPCRADAQGEEWDTYMARYGNKPGSVLVDLGLMRSAPDKKYPYLLITGPHAQNCNKQGIPANDDIAALEEILDATGNFVTGVTAKVLAGTFTYNCDRLNYYYVKDTTGIRDALGRMYARSYKDFNYTIKLKHDPQWVSYRTFLYPDSATFRWMGFNKTVSGMMQRGDSLVKKRDIRFEAYFRSDTDRAAFVAVANSKGYKTHFLGASESATAPFKAIVSQNNFVKMELIFADEDELKAAIKAHSGFYYGWSADDKGGK